MQVVRSDGFAEFQPRDPGAFEAVVPAPSLEPDWDYPLVMVEWHDAWFDFDQESPEDCRGDYLVKTVGFLVSDGPRFVSVAQEVLPDGDGLRAVTHIPVSVVERITRLAARNELKEL